MKSHHPDVHSDNNTIMLCQHSSWDKLGPIPDISQSAWDVPLLQGGQPKKKEHWWVIAKYQIDTYLLVPLRSISMSRLFLCISNQAQFDNSLPPSHIKFGMNNFKKWIHIFANCLCLFVYHSLPYLYYSSYFTGSCYVSLNNKALSTGQTYLLKIML